MSTVTTTGTGAVADAATGTPPPNTAATKFAGKYDTPEALETGTRELRKLLDLETPDGSFVGKDSTIARDTAQLEKHYLELQKLHGKMGSAKAPVAAAADPAKPAAGLKIEAAPVPVAVADNPNIDYDAFVKDVVGIPDPNVLGQQWIKEGKLTDEQYAKFGEVKDAKGKSLYPKSVVDTHMKGLQAIAQQEQAAAATGLAEATRIAGGETQLNNLLAWAGDPKNVPVAERERLNAQLKDPANYPIVAELLAARHRIALGAGNAQPLITGGTNNNPTGGATSREEWIRLCKSDRAEDAVRLAATVVKPEWTRA